MMKAIGFSARIAMMALAIAPIASSVAFAQAPVARTAAPDYVLGSGDKLRITVFGETGLTGEYTVTSTGVVSFPLIGDIPATGQTLAQVQDAIRAKLAGGYLKDPRVAVEVLEYRTFYILGEVNKPGEYPFRSNLTLEQAVATAGGYTYRANRKRFVIAHDGGAESPSRFKEAGQLRVQPGDTIRILERFF